LIDTHNSNMLHAIHGFAIHASNKHLCRTMTLIIYSLHV